MGLATAAIGIGSSLLAGRSSRRASESAERRQVRGQLAAAETQRQGQTGGVNALRSARGAAARELRGAGRTATGELRGAGELARQDLDPFTDFGTGQIGALQDILTSEGQLGFLENNPIFQAALRNANLGTNASAASQGRFRAGGTAQELFQNFLGTSFPLLQSQTRNLFEAVNLGRGTAGQQSAQQLQTGANLANVAQGTGTNLANLIQGTGANIANVRTGAAANISNLQSGIGDVQAAGDINRANIFGNTLQNVTGFLPTILDQFQNRQTAMAPPPRIPGPAGPGGANF